MSGFQRLRKNSSKEKPYIRARVAVSCRKITRLLLPQACRQRSGAHRTLRSATALKKLYRVAYRQLNKNNCNHDERKLPSKLAPDGGSAGNFSGSLHSTIGIPVLGPNLAGLIFSSKCLRHLLTTEAVTLWYKCGGRPLTYISLELCARAGMMVDLNQSQKFMGL
jgi:hypothetical protein